MIDKSIDLNEISFIGKGLSRPECVLVDKEQTLHIADWRGGVTLIFSRWVSASNYSKR